MREVLFFPIPNIKHFLKKKLIGKTKVLQYIHLYLFNNAPAMCQKPVYKRRHKFDFPKMKNTLASSSAALPPPKNKKKRLHIMK